MFQMDKYAIILFIRWKKKSTRNIYLSTPFFPLSVIYTWSSLSLNLWCNFGNLTNLWSGIESPLSKAYNPKGCFKSTRGFQPYILSYLASTAQLVETINLTIVGTYRLCPFSMLNIDLLFGRNYIYSSPIVLTHCQT